MNNIVNVYADESCHIEHDGNDFMALGCVYCLRQDKNYINNRIKSIKNKYHLTKSVELKWTKVSYSKLPMYKELVDLFCEYNINFRVLIAHGKDKLDHELFGSTYDEWYYKMYYQLLNKITTEPILKYDLYIDKKDTKSKQTTQKLKTILNYKSKNIRKIQLCSSDELLMMQLADIFIGATTYKIRGLQASKAKLELIHYLEEKLSINFFTSSNLTNKKFNVFHWEANYGY